MASVYKAVLKAKELVSEMQYSDIELSNPDEVADLVKKIVYRRMPIYDKVALVTVLLSGTVHDFNSFNIPPTCACCENFRSVMKDLKKHRTMYLFVYDGIDDKYYSYPIRFTK